MEAPAAGPEGSLLRAMEHVLQRQEGAVAGGDGGAAELCKLWRHRVLQLMVRLAL